MAKKLREIGSYAYGRVADESDWGGKNPPYVKPPRHAGGMVFGLFPGAPNVVRIKTPNGEELVIRLP